MRNQNQEKNRVSVKLMKTRAGRGFKLVVGEKWFYTSIPEMSEMLRGEANACDFRAIEGDNPAPSHPAENGRGLEEMIGGDDE